MKKLFYLFVLIIPSIAWCQNNSSILEFYPLTFVERIANISAIKSLVKADHLGKEDFFFTTHYKDNSGLFLLKKEKGNWFVYDYELYESAGRNTVVTNIKEANKRFVAIQVSSSPSGVCESHYGRLILIDVARKESTDFLYFSETQCYDKNGKASSLSTCRAKYTFIGDRLIIKTTNKKGATDCIGGGIYEYRDGKFVKMK